MSQTMTTLHPSNPYYKLSRHLDTQTSAILEPYSPPANQEPKHQRSASVPTEFSETTAHPTDQQQQRKASVPNSQNEDTGVQPPQTNRIAYRTRSIGGPFGGGVYFERQVDLSPPNDDEIIIATVRVTDSFRRASLEGCDELPSRPPQRGFLRRVSTRVNGSNAKCRYTAIKMPRRDYKRYFARDREGNYAGTEVPEKEWSEDDLKRCYSCYQDMPLRSIPGGQEFGEGGAGEGSSNLVDVDGETVDFRPLETWTGFVDEGKEMRTTRVRTGMALNFM